MLPGLMERLLGRGLGVARRDADRILDELQRGGALDAGQVAALRQAIAAGIEGTRDTLLGAGQPGLDAVLDRLDAIESRLAALEQAVARQTLAARAPAPSEDTLTERAAGAPDRPR